MRVEPSFPNVSRLGGKIWCPVQDNELIVSFSPLPPPDEVWNMRAANLVHCDPSRGHHEAEVADLLQIVGEPQYRPQFLACPTGNNYTLFDRTCQ